MPQAKSGLLDVIRYTYMLKWCYGLLDHATRGEKRRGEERRGGFYQVYL